MANEYKSSGVKSARYDSEGSSANYGTMPASNRRPYSGNGLGNFPMNGYSGMVIPIIYLEIDGQPYFLIPANLSYGQNNPYGALRSRIVEDTKKYSADAKKAQPVRGKLSGLETGEAKK